MIEKVKDFIESLKSNPRIVIFDEAATKQFIILPLLQCLGWNIQSVDEVRPEFPIENKKVDFSLHVNGSLFFIEVKKIGEALERYEKQLLEYCFLQGVEFAILTNGTLWWFYLPMKRVDWQARKFATLDLNQEDSLHVAQQLVALLSKGHASTLENAEAIYRRKSISETLPAAWNTLIKQSDSTLLERLCEASEQLCGYRPEAHEVKKFFDDNADNLIIHLEGKKHRASRLKSETPHPAKSVIVALSIAKILDAIAGEYFKTAQHSPAHDDNVTVYSHPDYLLQLTVTRTPSSDAAPNHLPLDQLEFIATPKQLIVAFERYCARHGMQNPYTSSMFTKRLSAEAKSLKTANWEIVRKEGSTEPYFKKIRGDRFIKLRKMLSR